MREIENKVKSIIADRLDVEISTVTLDSKIVNDLGGDSLDTTIIIMDLERHFFIVIPEEEIEAIQTVAQLIELVQYKLK